MQFNTVHDTQQIYRKLIEASSFPGRIQSIAYISEKIDFQEFCPSHLLALCITLMDGESTFYCDQRDMAQEISYLTYCRSVDIEDADFVILSDSRFSSDNMSSVKKGTLRDPHLGATVLWQVESLDSGSTYSLTGPGIKDSTDINIQTSSKQWIELREDINKEFPLGIDLFLLDSQGRLMVIPRTTMVKKGGA